MHSVSTQKGFSLIEAIIYIALFAFIIGGGMLSAFQLFDGQAEIQRKALSEAELNFVLRKLDWALNDSTVLTPSAGTPPGTGVGVQLEVDNGERHTFAVDGSGTFSHTIGTGPGAETYPLTTILNITDIEFQHVLGTPRVVTILLEIDGESLEPVTRYVR